MTFLQFQPTCCSLVFGLDDNVREQERLRPKRQISSKYQLVCWKLSPQRRGMIHTYVDSGRTHIRTFMAGLGRWGNEPEIGMFLVVI